MLAPVAHRQYVFTLPKLLRPIFSRQRAWLGELCRIAARLLTDAYAEAAPLGRPGLVLFVQTFGDRAYIKAHLHVLAADGGFGADGTFIALPPVPEALTCRRLLARSACVRGEGAGDCGRVAHEESAKSTKPIRSSITDAKARCA